MSHITTANLPLIEKTKITDLSTLPVLSIHEILHFVIQS